MKKIITMILSVSLFFLLSNSEVNATTVTSGWTSYSSSYASAIGFVIDHNVWQLEGLYGKYFSSTTDNEDGRQYGKVRVYVGVYHTKADESYTPPNGSTINTDIYMVIYKVITYPKVSNNEQGYLEHVYAYSDVDANDSWSNVMYGYGPENAAKSTSYTIGTSIGVNSSGPIYSMSSSETITLSQSWIDSNETSDPDFYIKYYYEKSRSNSYASSQRSHFGYFIVETQPDTYTFEINFEVYFSDIRGGLFYDYQHSRFNIDFDFSC